MSFDVVKRVDPAKDKIWADKVVEAFKNGSIETTGDFDRWAEALRNNARRSNGNNVHAGNRGAAESDARLDDRAGRAADGGPIADNSGGVNGVKNSVEPDHVQQSDPQQVSPEYAAALEAEQQYREGFNEGVGTPRSGFRSVRDQSPEMAAWYRMADEEGESGYHPLTKNRLGTLQASQLAQGKAELREGIQVPKKDIFGGFTSQTVSKPVNSVITPDAVANSIMEDARLGKLSHIVITDHKAKQSRPSHRGVSRNRLIIMQRSISSVSPLAQGRW